MSTYKVNALTATTIAATGIITASNATASTTTGTGAVVVTGGVGVGGAVYIGGLASVAGNLIVGGNGSFANITTVNLPGSSSTNGFQVLEAGLGVGSFVATQLGVAVTTGNAAQTYFTYNGSNNITNSITTGFNGVSVPQIIMTNDSGSFSNVAVSGNLTVSGRVTCSSGAFSNPVTMANTLSVSGTSTLGTVNSSVTTATNLGATGTLTIAGVSSLNNQTNVVLPGTSSTNGLVVTQASLGNGNFVGLVHGNSTGLGNAAQHYFTFNGDNASTNSDTWRLYASSTPQIQLVNTGRIVCTGNQTVSGFIQAAGSIEGAYFTTNGGTDQFTYLTGTWTPSIVSFSGGSGVTTATITTTRAASFLKIGKMVTLSVDITYNMGGSPANSVLTCTNLPYPKASGNQSFLLGDTTNIAGVGNYVYGALPATGRVYSSGGTQFTSTGSEIIFEASNAIYVTGQLGSVTGQIVNFSVTYLTS